MKDKNVSRITVRPLDRQAADRLGHIAWIEETDPQRAIKAMVDAVAIAPVNCAVWANAMDEEQARDRAAITEWRARHELSIFKPATVRFRPNFLNLEMALNAARDSFNGRAAAAEKYMGGRLTQIFSAAAFSSGDFQFRAEANHVTTDCPIIHIDDGVLNSLEREYRFIESVGCRRTYLYANDDGRMAPVRTRASISYTGGLRPEGFIDAWEPPADSLVLLTDAAHPHLAILHSPPFYRPDERPQRRTVMVYDFKAKL